MKFKGWRAAIALALGLATASANVAGAVTVANTGAQQYEYYWSVGRDVTVAALFSLAAPTTITELSLSLISLGGGTGTVAVDVAPDVAGAPGAPSFSTTMIAPAYAGDWSTAAWPVLSGLAWTLGAGDYWLVLSGTSAGDYGPAGPVPSPLASYIARAVGSPTWQSVDDSPFGVRIEGELARIGAVPLPAGVGLLVGAFGIAAAMRGVDRVRKAA